MSLTGWRNTTLRICTDPHTLQISEEQMRTHYKGSFARTVPRLRFVYDTSVVRGQRMSALIDAAVKKDRENAPPAANPAADADGSAGGEE